MIPTYHLGHLGRGRPDNQGADPFFSSVVALLGGTGPNNSTTITDESPLALPWTAVGNAKISTAQARFGNSSYFVDGTGDWLRSDTSAALVFGLAPWTIDGWYRPTTVSAGVYRGLLTLDTPADTGLFLVGNKLTWYAGANYQHQSTVSANTWVHVRVTSDAVGDVRLFQNGVLGTTIFPTGGTNYIENRYFAGASSVGIEEFTGYFQEVRVTNGVCRSIASFTPPDAPFPRY